VSEESPPPELEQLDRALRDVRFVPRASLGPELLGRLRHGERLKGGVSPWRSRPALVGVAAALMLAAATALGVWGRSHLWRRAQIVVDRCCYDFDGGGVADDGVTLVAEPDARVHRLRVYEDRDHSRDFSGADVVRLDRGADPSILAGAPGHLITIEHCCLDFDGGGSQDDALLVIGVPPDRVMMAAIYERPASPGSADALPLR
jgi:hypothetical protein